MIIEKLTHQYNKTILVFRDDAEDPFTKTVEVKTLPETLQSHIDAIADHIVSEKKEKYQEDKKQMPLGFNDPFSIGEEDPQEEGYTTHDAEADGIPVAGSVPEVDPDSWEGYEVPIHIDTDIADIKAMEVDHAVWYIENHFKEGDLYTAPIDALNSLKETMTYCGLKGTENCRSLKNAISRAVILIKEQ